jgi:hypothetical protein
MDYTIPWMIWIGTFHSGEGVPDFHLAAVAVHADPELHRLELLPLLVPPAAAAAAEQLGQVLQRATHSHGLSIRHLQTDRLCPIY